MSRLAPHVTLTAAEFAALRDRRSAIPVDDAVFRFEGRGAIDCLQGLLTNDVARLGIHAAAWGAFLTPKGMIITDAWVIADAGGSAWVVVPRRARKAAGELFQRMVPPRLARVADRSDAVTVRWLIGATPLPVAGAIVARPQLPAPMTALVLGEDAIAVDAALTAGGWIAAPSTWADAARLLLGWPTLGREIDERTLPQEVRFDELGAVKYDKGCYTGQETVARVHFRGHANRVLRGIIWASGDGPQDDQVTRSGKLVGTLRTVGMIGDRSIALAVLRREIGAGDSIEAGGETAAVTELPFEFSDPAVA